MKVIKEETHCLLLNYFGLNNRYYLAVTVMAYFDLKDPANPLKEQEMWPFVQGELGKDAILDMAMPKPRGEAVVWGRCFTPGGEPREASRVSLQIGPIEKDLYVFGDRYWKKAAGMAVTVGAPEPFTEMPVTYAHAFGGAGFDPNPAGKGFLPVMGPNGAEHHPLPNIEVPKHLVGSPSDRPDPAGFAPFDFSWPQRAKKLGTYDNAWFREHWPFYPEDMDWTYFNSAPEDQQIEDFFEGSEAFSVSGMHPKKPVVEGRLPGIRHRLFVNQLVNVAKPEGETVFKEVLTHIDTVWLFPHAEKGIAISRGSVEVKDDEALDVPHLYIVSEVAGQQTGTIEKYHQQFSKAVDRGIVVDMAPKMEEARKKLTGLVDMLRDLPLQISDSIAQNLGTAPKSVRTPVEVAVQTIATIDDHKKRLADGEKRLLQLKADYGHFMKIDTSGFGVAAQQLDAMKGKLAAIPGKVDAAKKDKAKYFKTLKDKLKELYDNPDFVKITKGAVDVEAMLPKEEEAADPWYESGMRFLEACRGRLIEDPEMMSAFRGLGFRPYTLKRSWIGINREEARFARKAWGLTKPGKGPDPDSLVIPAGLVIPRFSGAALEHITVRPLPPGPGIPTPAALMGALMDTASDAFVEGSKETALVLAPAEGKPFVCVENDMEAILLNQELGDFCSVSAMKDPSVKPPKDAADAVKKAPQFLVVSYPDRPVKDGIPDVAPWKKVCEGSEPIALPAGKNILEAKKADADLWQWAADALRPGVTPDPAAKPKDIDVMEPGAVASLIPVIDVAALVAKVRDDLMAKMKPGVDLFEAKKKEAMDLIGKQLAKQGHDIDTLMKDAPQLPEGTNPYTDAQSKFAQEAAALRQKVVDHGKMTPEVDKKLAEVEKKSQEVLAGAAKRFDEGTQRLAAARAKIDAGPPAWAKKLMAGAGIDSDDPAPLRQLTREDVIERYAKGLSLSTRNMKGVDLSGLDLKGADLSKALLEGANLSGVDLTAADLRQAIATGADFSKASLKGALLMRGIFQKTKFVGADMAQADLGGAMMSETDMTGANLSGASIMKTLLEKAKLVNVHAAQAKASQMYCLSADISGADFSRADLTKAVFLKTNIGGVNFSKSTLRETAFLESKGDKLDLSGADMHNSRILQGSAMTQSNFTDTKADRASWMKSDLSGSDFRGSTIERGLLQECDLTGSNFSGVNAKQARLTKSNLSDSNLKEINLFQGSLRKSKLVRTDLTRANLYGAEFYRTGVGETKLDDANLKMTKLHKRADLLPEPPKEKKK